MSNKLIGTGQNNSNGSICEPFLRDCDDSTIGEFVADGVESMLFIDWLSPKAGRAGLYSKALIPFLGAEGTLAGAPTSGIPASMCAFGNGVEMAEPCRVEIESFGVLKRQSDPLVSGGQLPYCEGQKIYNINGEVITDDLQWHEAQISRALMHDFKLEILNGIGPSAHGGVPNPNNPTALPSHWGLIPLLDGTARANGYGGSCGEWQSAQVLDWNGNALVNPTAPAGHGITLNGNAIADSFTLNFFTTLDSIYRGIKNLFTRMPHLSGNIAFGDIALVLPQEAIECILQAQACRLYCDAGVTRIDNSEARNFYNNSLHAGIGYGEIVFQGNVRIPIIPYNPYDYATNRGAMVNADGSFNAMMIWRGSAQQPLLGLEYNDLSVNNFDTSRTTRDSGMFQLSLSDHDDCHRLNIRHGWRIDYETLCLQVLIQNLPCEHISACAPDFGTIDALEDC